MTTKRITILNTEIDVLTMSETLFEVKKYLEKREPLHLMGVNADKINLANENKHLLEIINGCKIINADGASVVMASKYLGMSIPERVAGIDLMQNLIELCAKNGYSIYLLGAKQEVVEKTAFVLKKKNLGLKISGIRNGYFDECAWDEVAFDIKKSGSRIVFVGITSPLKEYLVEYLQRQGLCCVFMGVGGSFDVISGKVKRAPIWMQQCNLEWIFRMIQEPKRLGKRYLLGNLKFIMEIFEEKKTIRALQKSDLSKNR